jgi:hypothetical protein
MSPVEPPVVEIVAAEDLSDEVGRVSRVRVSVVPGVGLDANPAVPVDGVAVGVVSHQPALRGADAELAGSWVDGRVAGLQTALGAAVAGEVDGLQAAGVAWSSGDVAGLQASFAFSGAGGSVRGLQTSSGANVAMGDVQGAQAAMLNVAHGEVRGLQAGLGNYADAVDGVQASLANVAGDVRGLQLGLLNVADDADGLQLGLVNVARSSKVSIAPLNFVADGLHRIDVFTSDSAVGTLAAKFGSKHVYTLVGAGLTNPDQGWWTFGGGLGIHLPADPLWLEIDQTAWGLASGVLLAPGVHAKLRASAGFQVTKHVAPFAGVSANTWFGDGSVAPRAVGLPEQASRGRERVAWPGVHLGISIGQ